MKRFINIFLILLVISTSASAGTLTNFEYDATKQRAESGPGDARSEHAPTPHKDGDFTGEDIATGIAQGIGEEIGNALFAGVLFILAEGGRASQARIEGSGYPDFKNMEPRKTGEALLSFVRVDISYQDVQSDVTAVDVRGELGYGALGLQIRNTGYRETEPDDTLNMTQIQALYRMSLGNKAELDLGLGYVTLDGNETKSGVSFTTPLLIHPTDSLGFEFRPTWSVIEENVINDYDAAVLIGWRYASLLAGYRWVTTGDESLNGPQIGGSIRW